MTTRTPEDALKERLTHLRVRCDILAALAAAQREEEGILILLDGLSALGVTQSALWLARDADLILAGSRGLSSERAARLARVTSEDREAPIAQALDAQAAAWLASGASVRCVLPLRARAGCLGVLDLTGSAAWLAEEAERQALATLADQAAAAIERMRRSAQAELEIATQQRLLRIVGHDLRNPLAAIGLSAQALRITADRERAARSLLRITSSLKDAERTLDDLRDYAAAQAGELSVTRRLGDLFALVREQIQALRARSPEREVLASLQGDGQVLFDAGRLRQVLASLLDHAVTHGEAGAPILVQGTTTTASASLEITHQGPPLPAERVAELFSPVHRTSEDEDEDSGRLSLGLFVSRSIMAAHGGRLSVRSAPAGTVFTIELPLR